MRYAFDLGSYWKHGKKKERKSEENRSSSEIVLIGIKIAKE